MTNFEYVFPKDLMSVPALLAEAGGKAMLYAGGTDAIDRLKEGINRPARLVNLKKLKELYFINENQDGLIIGAGTRLVDVLESSKVREYTGLWEAVHSIATPQLRNMGTLGGNLCQRPRCWYYRSRRYPCLRKGGDECYVIFGEDKYHAIMGGGPCYIVYPSDSAPMLTAMDATLSVLGQSGERQIAVKDFYVLPDTDVENENVLKSDEVLTRINVPSSAKNKKSHYIKFRERQSLDFAIVSVAVVADVKDRVLSDVRIVYGGVAPVPWRAVHAEKVLEGQEADEKLLQKAGEAELDLAEPMSKNGYKVILAKNLLKRAVLDILAT